MKSKPLLSERLQLDLVAQVLLRSLWCCEPYTENSAGNRTKPEGKYTEFQVRGQERYGIFINREPERRKLAAGDAYSSSSAAV